MTPTLQNEYILELCHFISSGVGGGLLEDYCFLGSRTFACTQSRNFFVCHIPWRDISHHPRIRLVFGDSFLSHLRLPTSRRRAPVWLSFGPTTNPHVSPLGFANLCCVWYAMISS